ncbi:hypothetical protein [Microcoleus vaginatus]|uniref:hypothetical protein n=1 Tax=Microcoleus vaginatus TaxID=119532 RepID=UPI001F617732|nr:hypothetical protein D0A37_09785 [Microcoleus vaginatus HSN003]
MRTSSRNCIVDVDVVGWWGGRLATDFVADLTDGWLVGGRLAADLTDGWLVGGRLAADLTDGWLVGGD